MSGSVKPPKRVYAPQATRKRILDAAASAFVRRGYHATSMHDLMRLAAAPGGSVHYHFPTKKSLGLAVIAEAVADEVARTWIEPVQKAACARDGILSIFDAVAGDIEGGGGTVSGCPLTNLTVELALADPDFQAALQRVFERWRAAIADRLRDDVMAGRMRDIDPESLATFIVALFSGALALAKANQSAQPIRACLGELARLLRP